MNRDTPDAPLYSAIDLHAFAVKVINRAPLDPVLRFGRVRILFNREEWERENCVIELVRAQMLQAMEELDRESARRAAVSRMMD
jgi:hypothetical protein